MEINAKFTLKNKFGESTFTINLKSDPFELFRKKFVNQKVKIIGEQIKIRNDFYDFKTDNLPELLSVSDGKIVSVEYYGFKMDQNSSYEINTKETVDHFEMSFGKNLENPRYAIIFRLVEESVKIEKDKKFNDVKVPKEKKIGIPLQIFFQLFEDPLKLFSEEEQDPINLKGDFYADKNYAISHEMDNFTEDVLHEIKKYKIYCQAELKNGSILRYYPRLKKLEVLQSTYTKDEVLIEI